MWVPLWLAHCSSDQTMWVQALPRVINYVQCVLRQDTKLWHFCSLPSRQMDTSNLLGKLVKMLGGGGGKPVMDYG